MNVEIFPHIRDTAIRLGAGVPCALKVLAGRLADDPDMGRSSGLPGILTVTVDGDLFEDCPVLDIGRIREPDRIEIRYVSLLASAEPTADARRPARSPGPGHVGQARPGQRGTGVRQQSRPRNGTPMAAPDRLT
ncbi:hypothetical protein [Streptomyces sp. NPDC006510]|uniref:hypothetical protein n=1 Tax=Streptomyces sp. NPDC006510 TaxID=3155600 RepID=UPI0033BB451F